MASELYDLNDRIYSQLRPIADYLIRYGSDPQIQPETRKGLRHLASQLRGLGPYLNQPEDSDRVVALKGQILQQATYLGGITSGLVRVDCYNLANLIQMIRPV